MKFFVLLLITILYGCAGSSSIFQENSDNKHVLSEEIGFSKDAVVEIGQRQYKVLRTYFSASARKCAIVSKVRNTTVHNKDMHSKACFVEDKLKLLPKSLVNEASQ